MYSPFRYAGYAIWKKRPIQLTLFVTKRCNARCPFCFYLQKQEMSLAHDQAHQDLSLREVLRSAQDKLRDLGDCFPSSFGVAISPRNDTIHREPEITLQEIEKLAPSLGRLLWMAFSGGEVYLREDIVEISRVFYKYNKPSIMLYPTNGLTPKLIEDRTREILVHCPNSAVVVKLSLDGIRSEHDALRGVTGSFEKVFDTHGRLSKLSNKYPNLDLGFNTVFCSANQNNVDEILEFTRNIEQVRTHTLSMVRGDLADESFKDVDLDLYKKSIDKIENDLKKHLTGRYHFPGARFKSAQDILQRRLIYQTMQNQKRLLPCYAGRLNLVITETGDIYPCEVLDKSFGNVKDFDYDIRKLLQTAQAKSILHSISNRECYCSHECYFMTNILFNPRMYPALIGEYLKL